MKKMKAILQNRGAYSTNLFTSSAQSIKRYVLRFSFGIFIILSSLTGYGQLVLNGSFEVDSTPTTPSGAEFRTYTSASTPGMTNWIVNSTIDLHNRVHFGMGCPFPAPTDTNHVDLNRFGSITQSGITLVAGNSYDFSFWTSMHNRSFTAAGCTGGGTASAVFTITDASSVLILTDTVTVDSTDWNIWTPNTYTFLAPSGITLPVTLTFTGIGSCFGSGGVLIDDVVLDSITQSQSISCSDTCYWKVTGNNILSGNNIFGTISNDNVQLFTNNTQRGIFTNSGDFGWNTMTPTARLHVDVTSMTPTTGIRFEGLQPGNDNDVVTVDASGNLHTSPFSAGITNLCANVNFVPKTITPTGNLDCSQIFDDGMSVGIGTTGPFGYMPGAALTLGTPPPPATFTLSVNGWTSSTAFVALSDQRLKRDIQPIENALEKISKLNGVTYNWNPDFDKSIKVNGGRQIGFIAQDLEKVIPEATVVNDKGIYGVTYDMIIPVLTEAIKEQQQQIEELKKLIAAQNGSTGFSDASNVEGAYLAQNTPNPFSSNTEIKYNLPKATQSAMLGIYDLSGKQMRMYPLDAAVTTGVVIVNGSELQAGMYIYTLVINGKAFDSKRMVLTAQ